MMSVSNDFLKNIDRISANSRVVQNRQVIGSKPPISMQAKIQQNGKFADVLQDKIRQTEELKFSKHAEIRLNERNIQLTQSQKDRIDKAVDKAEEKGIRDTLVLMDNLAFVVNVKNRTVITVVNSSELKENVFTNIDGAVIM